MDSADKRPPQRPATPEPVLRQVRFDAPHQPPPRPHFGRSDNPRPKGP